MKSIAALFFTAFFFIGAIGAVTGRADELEKNFIQPPPSARPWVYWFWNNGNVTSNGITADLEAMQRVGIGGVLIMDVKERFAPPQGTAEFMNPEWRNLFEFSVQEAARLGLEINMNDGPGWTGSSGPWITPELSMQKLVWTNLTVTGPTNFSAILPQPSLGGHHQDPFNSQVQFKDYYADIGLLAFPATTNGMTSTNAVLDLSARLGSEGKLDWAVPAGEWTIQRIGHASTGSSTRPPVAGGNGLECDKLSRAGMNAQFAGMMAKLIRTAGPLVGKSLVATHIDSWEVGPQNWTAKLRGEFQRRRGYDPLPWLPCVTDAKHPPVNPALAARFRWDFSQTIAELLAENYSGRIAELAHAHGLRFTLEGYTLPFGDQFTYAARADEPMTEFWTGSSFDPDQTDARAQQAASVAHVYGHAVVGAESFTSGAQEKWKLTPADIKSQGDYEFCQGVNRFVIHRYAHQPYLNRFPGATMGPWGLHYERTQTWWEMSGPWHEYLARCQYLLRRGYFVADLLCLRPERPNQTTFTPALSVPSGYRWDQISAEALLQFAAVKNGRIVLPGGMIYGVLVLPPAKTMTPALLEKIRELTRAGATVVASGPPPEHSPSLQDYPHCDEVVTELGREMWGNCDGRTIKLHDLGKGRLVWGETLAKVLSGLNLPVDFATDVRLNWIHRQDAGTEIYFLANPSTAAVEACCTFCVKGLRPELWNPETGDISPLAAYEPTAEGETVPLRFDPSGSVFVIFRQRDQGFDPVVKLLRDGQPVPAPAPPPAELKIVQATYGVPGDVSRTRDVRVQVQQMVDAGETTFKVAELAKQGDPAYGVVKTFSADYTIGGKNCKAAGQDPDHMQLRPPLPAPERPAEVICDSAGRLKLVAREPGRYEWITAGGKTNQEEIDTVAPDVTITGPWQVSFPPDWGAPASVTLTNLISWTDSPDDGVKYFSGTATYRATFDLPAAALKTGLIKSFLDLGDVRVMARVKLNGQDCGIAWKTPFRVDVTGALRAGRNGLEVQVADLWPNRMIGDAGLPADQRFTWSSWEPFTKDTPLLPSGMLGPVRLVCGFK